MNIILFWAWICEVVYNIKKKANKQATCLVFASHHIKDEFVLLIHKTFLLPFSEKKKKKIGALKRVKNVHLLS